MRFTHRPRTEPGNSPGDSADGTRAPSPGAHHLGKGRCRGCRAVPARRHPGALSRVDRGRPGVRFRPAHRPVVDAAAPRHGGHQGGHARPRGGGGVGARHPHPHQRRHPAQPTLAGGGDGGRAESRGAAAQPRARGLLCGPLRAAHRPPGRVPGGTSHHGALRSVAAGAAGPGSCLALDPGGSPAGPCGRSRAHGPRPGHGRPHHQHLPSGRHRLPQPARVRAGRRPAADPLAVHGPDGDADGPPQRRSQRAAPDGGARHQRRALRRGDVRGRGAGGRLVVRCRLRRRHGLGRAGRSPHLRRLAPGEDPRAALGAGLGLRRPPRRVRPRRAAGPRGRRRSRRHVPPRRPGPVAGRAGGLQRRLRRGPAVAARGVQR